MRSSGSHRLRPGLVAVRRDETHLQLGLDPPGRVILPDTGEIRGLLSALARGGASPPATVTARRAFEDLLAAGLLVATRPEATYGVRLDGPADLAAAIRPLLGGAEAAPPALTLLLDHGPLPRERADELLRDGTPHLVVTGGPDAWTVGPLVVPGHTACLRCVDAQLGERDPRRGLVLEQLTRHSAHPPPDPLLQALALPWAARDVLLYLAGTAPPTWSTSYTFRRSGAPEESSWGRHPHCGCAWDLIAME